MQVTNYNSQSFQPKPSSVGLKTSQMNFLSSSQQPASINRNFSSENINKTALRDEQFINSLNSDNSFINTRTESYQLEKWQNQYSHESASNSLNQSYQSYFSKQNPQKLTDLVGKVSASDLPIKDQSSLYQYQQTGMQKPLQYNLMKIEYQSFKRENDKLNETVLRLRKQLEEKVSTLQKFNQLMKIKYTELKDLKAKLQLKQQIIGTLQQKCSNSINSDEATRLKQLLMCKNKELDQINGKINNLQHQSFKNQVFQMKINKLYEELEQQKTKNNNYLLEKSASIQKVRQLEEKVAILEFDKQKTIAVKKVAQIQQIQNLFKTPESSPTKSNRQSTHLTAFQEALKVQMKQIQELKQVIDSCSEVVQKLKDNLITSRRQLQELRGEMKILDLKASSERKNLIMEYRLQIHEKDNEINTFLKKYKTLEDKYKNALIEIKAKDDFFKQYLVGRTTQVSIQESIEAILKQYTQNFDSLITLKTENSSLKERLEKYRKFEEEIDQC